jgi:hypothetical protein
MRKIILILCVFAFYNCLGNNTWVVSNVQGFSANFNNLQACVSSPNVLAGDVVIVQGSGTSYGDIVVSKPLIILGPGFFLNQNPQTQAILASAKLNSIFFKKGSSGSIMQGLEVIGTTPYNYNNGYGFCWGGTADTYSIKVDSSSITCIGNRWVNWFQISNSSSTTIKGSFGEYVCANNDIGDLQIQNTIFGGAYCRNAVISNCFVGEGFAGHTSCIDSSILKNNIIHQNPGYFSVANSQFSHNVFIGLDPLGANIGNNIVSGDANSVFIGYPNQGSYSSDGKYKLKIGSIAIANGEAGVDIGPFGGPEPYKLSGIAFHPNIWWVEMPTTGTSGGGLPIKIKVNANN